MDKHNQPSSAAICETIKLVLKQCLFPQRPAIKHNQAPKKICQREIMPT